MFDALHGQIPQISQRQPGAARIQTTSPRQSAPHRGHLEVDQRRGREFLSPKTSPDRTSVRAVVDQRDGKDARVND